MIDLYTWNTLNGRKVSILLEELEVPYRVHPIDISKAENQAPEYRVINPNAKIPAIVDTSAGITLTESGAILIYLAERHGRFLAPDGPARHHAIEWLMWQMSGFGPTVGQAHHYFGPARGRAPYAEERFRAEVQRLYGVLERRLAGSSHVASEDYSIADIAIWANVSRFGRHEVDLRTYPAVRDWYVDLARRPGIQRGFKVPNPDDDIPLPPERR